MATTHFTPLTLDEYGRSILDPLEDYDLDLAAPLTRGNQHTADTQNDIVFSGTGLLPECCDVPVVLSTTEDQQETNTPRRQEQSYPSPYPPPVLQPYYHQPAQVAPLVASRALQTLNGLSGVGNRNAFVYPLTAPETSPAGSLEWVLEHPYTVRVDNVTSMQPEPQETRDSRRPSVASMETNALSNTTHADFARPYACRTAHCKPDGKIATFKTARDRNKHEKRVHGLKEDRPHACNTCEARFNHPRELRRHCDAKHSCEPATVACHLCPSSFKHRVDHLDRHLKHDHPAEWPAIKESRKAHSESVTGSGSTAPMTPSTTSGRAMNGLGLLTPPPSRGSYQLEFPPLPTPSS